MCPGGVAVEAPFELVDDGLSARVDPARPATVRGYLPALDGGVVRRSVEEAARNLGHLQAFGLRPIGELVTRVVLEEDWADAWKSHYPTLRVGRRLVIKPTWREHDAQPGEVVLELDPGMAFGTGLHPTTRLCLAAIEDVADAGFVAGARVLDVGCGSGILSVAAARLGAAEVLAVDTDPIAVQATLANAQRNSLGEVIRARQGTIGPDDRQFDLVLANLIASLLVGLAPRLREALSPGGRIVAGGIFVDREDDVRSAFTDAGLSVLARSTETYWASLTAGRAS